MGSQDSFRLFSQESIDRIVLAVVLFISAAIPSGCIPVAPASGAAENILPCAATVAQYGPGERWTSSSPTPRAKPSCVAVAAVVPDHILTMPVNLP